MFRRAAASVITLGSGASLGPEAPSVELGANTAAVFAPKHLSKRRQRMLVAAGAAAGGTAGRFTSSSKGLDCLGAHGRVIFGVQISLPQRINASETHHVYSHWQIRALGS